MITKTKPRKPAKADKPRGASKPETLPASFKDIGHAVRENFERKAAALYERWKKGDVDLQSSEVDLLKKVPTETLSRHELERAMGLFERYGRKEKPKGPSPKIPAAITEKIHHTFCPRGVAEKAGTAIAVRPAAVTVKVVDDLSTTNGRPWPVASLNSSEAAARPWKGSWRWAAPCARSETAGFTAAHIAPLKPTWPIVAACGKRRAMS